MMKYSIIDHTADLAVEFYGSSIPELFHKSAVSLSEIIFGKRAKKRRVHSLDIEITGKTLEIKYVDFLREILYHINQDQYYFCESKTQFISENSIIIHCSYLKLKKNDIKNEIKAVTYHACGIKEKIKDKQKTYYAKVTFDI